MAGFVSSTSAFGQSLDPISFIRERLARGEKSVILPKGRYRVAPRPGETLILELKGLKDVVIDFGNSEFIGTIRTRMLTMVGCTNCVFKNLAIDYDELPFTQAIITEVDDEKNWIVEVLEGYPLPHRGNYEWPLQAYDAKTGELINPMRFRDGIRIEPMGGRRYRVTGGKDRRGSVGDIAVWSVKEPPGVPVEKGSLHAQNCSECIFDSITVYSSPHGCAFRDYFGDDETYVRCKVIRRPLATDLCPRAMKRLRSGNHDAFMMRGHVRGPKIIDCEAKYHCDDCVNIGGMFGVVTAVTGCTARVLFNYLGPSIDAGDTCEVVDAQQHRVADIKAVRIGEIGTSMPLDLEILNKTAKVWPGLDKSCETVCPITFDRPLEVGSFVISKRHQGWGFLVQGCDFGHNRARGIIASTTGLIASNRCEATNGPVVYEAGPSFTWMEGGFSEDIAYRDNAFPPPGAIWDVPYGRDPEQKLDVYLPPKTVAAKASTPVIVYIHGGAWIDGDKRSLASGGERDLWRVRSMGVAVVSIGYRKIGQAGKLGVFPPVKLPLDDQRQALQFITDHAAEWHLDLNRLAFCGGSAGACSAQILAFENGNPFHVKALGLTSPQTTLDPLQVKEWIPNGRYGGHAFGLKYNDLDAFMAARERLWPEIVKFSPIHLAENVADGDMPTLFIRCRLPGVLDKNVGVHASEYGYRMKEYCDRRGVACQINIGSDSTLFQVAEFLLAAERR